MPIIYLLRHAQSTANTKGILAGRDNSVELTKQGFGQAKKLVQVLDQLEIGRIVSSPLTRCLQTIEPFRDRRGKIPFSQDERLIEMDYGNWSGQKLSKLARKKEWRTIQNTPSLFTFPGGESFKSMRSRVDNLFRSLDNQKGPILLVTHGDIVKMFLASAAGLKIDGFQKFVIEPGSISTIGSRRGKYSILGSNTYPAHASKNVTTNTIGGGDFLIKQLQWWKK